MKGKHKVYCKICRNVISKIPPTSYIKEGGIFVSVERQKKRNKTHCNKCKPL